MQDIDGICTLFGLERVAEGRFSVAFVVQSRADEPECWDGLSGLFKGMVSAANDSERLLAAGTPQGAPKQMLQ